MPASVLVPSGATTAKLGIPASSTWLRSTKRVTFGFRGADIGVRRLAVALRRAVSYIPAGQTRTMAAMSDFDVHPGDPDPRRDSFLSPAGWWADLGFMLSHLTRLPAPDNAHAEFPGRLARAARANPLVGI